MDSSQANNVGIARFYNDLIAKSKGFKHYDLQPCRILKRFWKFFSLTWFYENKNFDINELIGEYITQSKEK